MNESDPIELVYISDSIIPSKAANSIQVMKTCESFVDNGCKVTLVVPDHQTESTENIYDYYGIDHCFDITRVPWKPTERYQFALLSGAQAARANPDIVYSRFIPSAFFYSLLGGAPVLELHSPPSEHGSIIQNMFSFLVKYRNVQLVVISNALREHLTNEYNIDIDRVVVAHDAAGLPKTDPEPVVDTSDFTAGYIGQLYEGKGMSMIAELAQLCPWATFHVVGGSTSDVDTWKRRVEATNITFHGFVPPRETPAYRHSFDVLLAPYRQEVYGKSGETDLSQWMSPLKIFEYMSAEKPIIASDLPVLREVLTHRDNSILCDPSDPTEWVHTLEELRDYKQLRHSLGSNAKRDFMENYTYNKRCEWILKNIC